MRIFGCSSSDASSYRRCQDKVAATKGLLLLPRADTIIEDVENYLFSKPGDLQKYISNALVQCAAASSLTRPTY